ncbi:MAG: hypothetical protein LBF50_08910 [Azoarcus sp.]|jgi:hypothetical protein|nr:hypothetical protein [Azoarcus sp.]
MSRQFDLVGPRYVLRRGLPWSITMWRGAPGPERTPIDMTGCSARFEVTNVLHPPPYPDAVVYPVAVMGASGICHVILSAADTAAIKTTAARYRLVITDSLGNDEVVLYGRLAILEAGK